MKSAITVSLVEEARGGPFVFWDGLQDACEQAGKLGFDAIEIFAPSTDVIDATELQPLLDANGLKVAALGTGAGMVKHGLSLTNPDSAHRAKAIDFVNQIASKAGEFGASAIIGSMQGRWGGDTDRDTALGYLGEALEACGKHALQFGVPLIYEPLNRYETNLCNTVADGVALLNSDQHRQRRVARRPVPHEYRGRQHSRCATFRWEAHWPRALCRFESSTCWLRTYGLYPYRCGSQRNQLSGLRMCGSTPLP